MAPGDHGLQRGPAAGRDPDLLLRRGQGRDRAVHPPRGARSRAERRALQLHRPATTLTERIARNLDTEQREALAKLSPLARLGAPEDSAHAAVFLASDAAGFLTGVTLDVAGGRVMA